MSTQEGFDRQIQRGKQQHGKAVEVAVRQAIAAVQRDPLRSSTPLLSEDKLEFHRQFAQFLASQPDRQKITQRLLDLTMSTSASRATAGKTSKTHANAHTASPQSTSDTDIWHSNFYR